MEQVRAKSVELQQRLSSSEVTWDDLRVLAVSPLGEDSPSLQRIFRPSRWRLVEAQTCRAAFRFLVDNTWPVIICEQDLSDGNWKDLLQRTAFLANPPRLIVSNWHADEYLWAEVLNLGGYDVLAKPFDEEEVFRVVGFAWRNWMDECRMKFRGRAKAAI